ncbi:MAG TPA: hypothetical protein VM901_12440 [Bdellovibrionota bacterium]|jgi:hypothetical protein|nr:hypothetical protein [Bdellovibrionota bacterium]
MRKILLRAFPLLALQSVYAQPHGEKVNESKSLESRPSDCGWKKTPRWMEVEIQRVHRHIDQSKLNLRKMKAAELIEVFCSYYPWLSAQDRASLQRAMSDEDSEGLKLEFRDAGLVSVNFGNYYASIADENGVILYNPRKLCQGGQCEEPLLKPGQGSDFRPVFIGERKTLTVPLFLKDRYPEEYKEYEKVSFDGHFLVSKEELAQFVDYFSVTRDRGDVEKKLQKHLLDSGQDQKSTVQIPLNLVLPLMAEKRVNTYPTEELLDGDDGPNCYASVRGFYKQDVEKREDNTNSRELLHGLLSSHYQELSDDNRSYRFGDVIQNRTFGHAVRVLFTDRSGKVWTMSKQDGADTSAWQVLTKEDAFRIGKKFSTLGGEVQALESDLFHYRKIR